MAEYAVCSTTYNCAPRLEASLRSLQEATQGLDCQWRIVDNLSRDGTWEMLRRWAQDVPGAVVVQRRCNRGLGRQMAFQASNAPYVIRADLDTVYLPLTGRLLQRHRGWSGRDRFAIRTRFLDVAPRRLLEQVGGWRPLNYLEDVDLWHRLSLARSLRTLVEGPIGKNWTAGDPERRQEGRLLPYAWRHFRNTRDLFRSAQGNSLPAKVRMEAAQTSHPIRYWAVTVPMMALAWGSQALERKLPPAPPDGDLPLALEEML